ncbi:starch synthase 4 isoform X1 [Wolffia australiana]
MATSESCSMFLGRGSLFSGFGGRAGSKHGVSSFAVVDTARRARFVLNLSCKMRQKNISSKSRRQPAKKGRRNPSSLRDETRNAEGSTKVQNSPDDHSSSAHSENSYSPIIPASDAINVDSEGFEQSSSLGREMVIQQAPNEEQLQGFAIGDLTGMIRNAEKNILLLNKARISALENLDKILVEKDDLQAEIRRLETELANTGLQPEFPADKKDIVHNTETEISARKSSLEIDSYQRSLDSDFPSLGEEIGLLREENRSLKEEIEKLKIKLKDGTPTDVEIRLATNVGFSGMGSVIFDSNVGNKGSERKDIEEQMGNTLDTAAKQANNATIILQKNEELQKKFQKLESTLMEENDFRTSLESARRENELLQQKVENLEERLRISDQEIDDQVELYHASVKEFEDALDILKEEGRKRATQVVPDNMPLKFWSQLLLTIEGWFLEKKITIDDAKLLRDMARKKDGKIRDAYIACKEKNDQEAVTILRSLITPLKSPGLHIVHIAAEMAPVAKVGGLGDVVTGLSKALQKKGHLVEIILPKYDCMNHDVISDMKELDVTVNSYFDGQQFENKIWIGIVEGLPVYFIEPCHPWKFFWRGKYYGEHDDFKRFSFFSRAALELLLQSGKKPDIIHCHDWQTSFVPPLYWDIYSSLGLNSARICFTCHNFEYQGASPASELGSCGLDVHQLLRPDRMQDNSSHDRINPVKGAIVYSNIVTTVSPTYAQEVRTAEGGRGLHETLNFHSKKFFGILNGIDTDAWNPATDVFLDHQYSADDLHGKADNKAALRQLLNLSSENSTQPLVCCITRLVPQKGVHLIRHAIYRTLELGGQFILLGSSPVPHIQREFEEISNHFRDHLHARLILTFDDALSHAIFAASDMFVIPSIFEPCGLTQMIAMRYGSVPIARRTGGLNDSVFDVDDKAIPDDMKNGFTFLVPDEKGLSGAMERSFNLYLENPEVWRELVQKNMRTDFSWDASSSQYEELYEKAVMRAQSNS